MFATPLTMMRLGMQAGLMMFEAQQVMSMRMLGMMGAWRVTPAENGRMLSEKLAASREAIVAAGAAMAAGKSAAAIAGAALKPYSRRTKSNAKRLARRGPGRPS